MTTDEKDFLARWSQRKQAARDGIAEPDAEQPTVPAETADLPAGEASVVETAYADFDFDALDYHSDYTQFMEKDVPEMVRQRALRALWRSDPILANVDGLNDYDQDFTDAALVVENLASAYRPGKGYATDEEEAVEETLVADVESASAEQPAGEEPAALDQGEEAPIEPEDTRTGESEVITPEDDKPAKA